MSGESQPRRIAVDTRMAMSVAALPDVADPEVYTIQGRTVRLPVAVRDASSAFASFVVPTAAMRRLLPPGLQPVELFPGRSLCSIAAIEYRDNDLGQYNEVAIAFAVGDGQRKPLPLIDFLRNRVAAYIHRLPVTEAFTCEAGSTIWGFPKTIERITFEDAAGTRSAHLSVGGQHVLTFTVQRRGRRRFAETPLSAFSYRDGVLRRTPFTSSGEGVGYRLGGATLQLGTHAMADELRSLGLPKRALMSGWVERMQMRFGPPTVINQDRNRR